MIPPFWLAQMDCVKRIKIETHLTEMAIFNSCIKSWPSLQRFPHKSEQAFTENFLNSECGLKKIACRAAKSSHFGFFHLTK